jgi:dTDP-glucose 4,6-dehydratase
MNALVTGGLGFIGSHFIKQLLSEDQEIHVFNIDNMSYGSNRLNLHTIEHNPRYHFIKSDINKISNIEQIPSLDLIVNIAAESHVDRSIAAPRSFIYSNFQGTFELLEYARKNDIRKFVQISTDEVYGAAYRDYSFKEADPVIPSNPYSASKAAADILAKSYFRTYGLNVLITRCSNNFGPNQFPEKLIPRTIIRALLGYAVVLYGNGQQVRDWIYVTNHVDAILEIIQKGVRGEIYNISSSNLLTNLEMVNKVSKIIGNHTGRRTMVKFGNDRPGHDNRYSLDSTKIRKEVGWIPKVEFDEGLSRTVLWYVKNESWWRPLIDNMFVMDEPWNLNRDDDLQR